MYSLIIYDNITSNTTSVQKQTLKIQVKIKNGNYGYICVLYPVVFVASSIKQLSDEDELPKKKEMRV